LLLKKQYQEWEETFKEKELKKENSDTIIIKYEDGTIKKYAGFFISAMNHICVKNRRNARRGMVIPWSKVISIKFENTESPEKDEFKTYEEFEKQFDFKYTSKDFIMALWNETSPQHGGKYKKSDFKYLSGKGKKAAEDFDKKFSGVGQPVNNHYMDGNASLYDGKEYKVLKVKYYSYVTGKGRDITISYQTNIPNRVFYSSEFQGCGNGSYYFLVSKNKVLHYEND